MRFTQIPALACLAFLVISCASEAPVVATVAGNGAGGTGKADQASVKTAACSFDANIEFVVDSSDRLETATLSTVKLTAADIDGLTAVQQSQILTAGAQLQVVEADRAELGEVFAGIDDNTLWLHQVRILGVTYDWAQLYLGDTEVGVVFETATATIVAEIGDGDVMGCHAADTASEEPTQKLTCHWDIAFAFETSADMKDVAEPVETVSTGSKVDDMTARQIVLATVHLQFFSPDTDPATITLDQALEHSDDGEVDVLGFEVDGQRYDWVRFYAGDTEVGVVFEHGGLDIAAEVGDGDVLGCTTGAQTEPTETTEETTEPVEPVAGLVCDFETGWVADGSNELEDASKDSVDIEADSHLDALTTAQILAAAIHLAELDGDTTLEDAFEAVDEGLFVLHTVDLDGQLFDWVQAWAGDTEIGVVFEPATTQIVAEIGDGDVLGCATPE